MKKVLALLALLACAPAHAQFYNLFGPATGILKGSTTTPQTTAAASSDVVGLFSGCSVTSPVQYLGQDGACHTPVTGSVTSVALADGSTSPIYTITGSPVTTSGTLTFTLSTEAAHAAFIGPSTGSPAQPTFRALVATDIPALAYVTSVAFADASTTSIYSVTGSPVTSSGTLTVTLKTETANTVFAGPTTGAAAQPTFRALVAVDMPSGITATLPGTTGSIGGGSLANGACATGTVAVTSSTTSMSVAVAPAGGTQPGNGFTWDGYVSVGGTVTVRVCNATGATNTPTATTYNVRVLQ